MKKVFLLFLLFQNVFTSQLQIIRYFSYWDEICFMFFITFFIVEKTKIHKSDLKYLLTLLGICLLGILGDFIFQYQYSYESVIRDIIGFLKFPLTLFVFTNSEITSQFAVKMYGCIRFIKITVVLIFIFSVGSLLFDFGMTQNEFRLGLRPFMFLFSHPTYLTTCLICILCIFYVTDINSKLFDFLIISTIFMALRTKGMVFIVVFIYMKYGSTWIEKIKFLYWAILSGLIIATSYGKLMLYASYSNSPRESLYKGMLQLIKLCFPIGSGFATYASHVSAIYLSKVYNFIYIPDFYTYDGAVSAVIGDAGYPYYIGQFGVLGSILIIYLSYQMIKSTTINVISDYQKPTILIWILILISLTSEALLVNNGFELAFILAIISRIAVLKSNGNLNYSQKRLCINMKKSITQSLIYRYKSY